MAGKTVRVYVEAAPKRVFAGAVDWPGWDRSGKTERLALEAFAAAADRYRRAVGRRAVGKTLPRAVTPDDLEVVERRPGGSGTDFGVPSSGASADERPVDDAELRSLTSILEAAWAAFDRAAAAAVGIELRKGPRGGGRELDKIRTHVLEAERAYLGEIGRRRPDASGTALDDRMAAVRKASLASLTDRAHGVEVDPGRRAKPFWTPRYFVRRSAWHALDHAWEIEDRSTSD